LVLALSAGANGFFGKEEGGFFSAIWIKNYNGGVSSRDFLMKKIISPQLVTRFFLCSLMIGILLGTMTLGNAHAQLEHLVAVWHLDEDPDDDEVVKDSSGNGNDGKLLGGESIEGMVGNALQFNGTAQNGVIIEHNSNQVLKDQMTVEAWIMPIAPGDYASVIRKGIYKAAGGTTGWSIDTGVALAVRKFMYLKAGLSLIGAGAVTLKLKEWQHIAFTYDGKELKGYLDGELYSTIAATGDLAECKEGIGIGIRPDSTSAFNGAIDEVVVWSVARTQEEIKKDMDGVSTAPVEALDKLATTWSAIKAQ